MNFNDWFLEREIVNMYTEIFDKDTFLNKEPENGEWEPELGKDGRHGVYYFNYSLPSDPKKTCNNSLCYSVVFDNGSIAFKHKDTGYADRWQFNYAASEEIAKKLSVEQINSILHAIGKYIQTVKPDSLIWNPIAKSGSKQNVNAREKVYFLWAAKNIFPEYVPYSKSHWTKIDLFMEKFKELKDLPSKEEIEAMGVKKFLGLIDEFRERKNQLEMDRQENERQQLLNTILVDPVQNPQQLQIGDLVYNKEEGSDWYHGRLFKIIRFRTSDYYYENERHTLIAILKPEADEELPHHDDESNYSSLARHLHKATPENSAIRTSQIQNIQTNAANELRDLLSNPSINPNGVSIGDVVYVNRRGNSRHGSQGKILSIKKDIYNDYGEFGQGTGLYAEVKPIADEKTPYTASKNIGLRFLVKVTPESQRIRQYNSIQPSPQVQMPPDGWQPPAATVH